MTGWKVLTGLPPQKNLRCWLSHTSKDFVVFGRPFILYGIKSDVKVVGQFELTHYRRKPSTAASIFFVYLELID